MSACMHGFTQVAAELLERGADPDAVTFGGQTALFVAAIFGQDACIQILLKYGVDTNFRDSLCYSALILAVGNCNADTIKLLIAHGADVHAMSEDRMTALRLAQQRGQSEVILLLKAAGALE